MNTILVFDADNTLWDTDSVFKNAQLTLLETLAKEQLTPDPNSALITLRAVDQQLFSQMGRFEYNFKVLAAGMAFLFDQNLSVEEAVSRAIQYSQNPKVSDGFETLIEQAFQAFQKELLAIPNLFVDATYALIFLHGLKQLGNPIVTVLLSEGRTERISQILKAHKLRDKSLSEFFNEVLICKAKSKDLFEEAKQKGLQHFSEIGFSNESCLLAVGDSLKRDIKFGNQAGYLTVYKPANFLGAEEPSAPDEEPDYTIKSLNEFPEILLNMGIHIQQSDPVELSTVLK